jgi:hypothetical protein
METHAMTDPFTAAKRDLEERDRVKMLAGDARARLQKFTEWPDCSHEDAMAELLAFMSWNEARTALEYIDWEDNHAEA